MIGTHMGERYLLKISILFSLAELSQSGQIYKYHFTYKLWSGGWSIFRSSMCTDQLLLCEFLFLSLWPSRVTLFFDDCENVIQTFCNISAPHKTILLLIAEFFRTWSMQVSSSIILMLSVNSSKEATMAKNVMLYCTRSFCVHRHHLLRN